MDKKDPEEGFALPKKDPPPVKAEKKELKKSDIRILLAVREMLRKQAHQAELHKQSHTITEVDQKEYILDVNSLESYIVRVLSSSKTPVHITDIISKCEQLGWETSTVHHKYATVYRALKDNYYMFSKVDKATFTMRAGFIGEKPEKNEHKEDQVYNPDVPTITDVVLSVAEKFQTESGIYPSRVHYIMKRMGYKCGYSSVYRAMQDERFSRNGYWYLVK